MYPHVLRAHRQVSGCLKLFFRELDEPLLTFRLHEAFNAAVGAEDPEMRFEMLAHVLKQMPSVNFHTLHVSASCCNVHKRQPAPVFIIPTPSLN